MDVYIYNIENILTAYQGEVYGDTLKCHVRCTKEQGWVEAIGPISPISPIGNGGSRMGSEK